MVYGDVCKIKKVEMYATLILCEWFQVFANYTKKSFCQETGKTINIQLKQILYEHCKKNIRIHPLGIIVAIDA